MVEENLVEIGDARISRIVIGRLKIGADLLDSIEEIVRKGNVKTGVILSGVGALQRAVFRNAKVIPPDYRMEDKYRLFVDIDSASELISLTGWITTTTAGELNIHAHFMTTTIIDDKIMSFGGHLVKGTKVSIKAVVTIGVLEGTNIKAELDPVINQVDISFR